MVSIGWLLSDRRACAGADLADFFAKQGAAVERAKAICAGCTVRSQCLDYALAYGEDGVWGGVTGRERRRMTQEQYQELQVPVPRSVS
jgi:WhiB family redox-sensing transcriptional regulator